MFEITKWQLISSEYMFFVCFVFTYFFVCVDKKKSETMLVTTNALQKTPKHTKGSKECFCNGTVQNNLQMLNESSFSCNKWTS